MTGTPLRKRRQVHEQISQSHRQHVSQQIAHTRKITQITTSQGCVSIRDDWTKENASEQQRPFASFPTPFFAFFCASDVTNVGMYVHYASVCFVCIAVSGSLLVSTPFSHYKGQTAATLVHALPKTTTEPQSPPPSRPPFPFPPNDDSTARAASAAARVPVAKAPSTQAGWLTLVPSPAKNRALCRGFAYSSLHVCVRAAEGGVGG